MMEGKIIMKKKMSAGIFSFNVGWFTGMGNVIPNETKWNQMKMFFFFFIKK